MPTITINKKALLKLIGKKLSDKALKENIPMLGTDLEKIDKTSLTIEIYPNRPDLLSEEGLARALQSFLNIKIGFKNYSVKKSNYSVKVDKKVNKVRPFVVAAVIKNITLTDEVVESLMQLQEKLHLTHGRNRKKLSIGVYDLDTIEFPLTYTTKPHNYKFTPLETKTELTLSQILQKHPKGREFANLLKGFKEYPIWLDNKNQVLSMPPIINSEETRVKPKTKNLFIDITGLDPIAIEQALNIIVVALADRNAKIYQVKINNKNYPNLKPDKMKINLLYINKLLGLNLKENEIKTLLRKMGFDYKDKQVLIPCYRTDILHEIDIAEDIAIAYDYEKFTPELPNIATVAEESKESILQDQIAEILIGLGLLEVNTFYITNKENLSKKMEVETNYVELKNALTEDHNVLRSWLLPSLIEVLSKNKHNEYPQKIFEIAKIFTPKLEEPLRLACAISSPKTDFTKIKQILDSLFLNLNIEYEIENYELGSFIEGRIGKIKVKSKEVGVIGELHPKVLENWQLKNPVAAFEIDLEFLK